jgi:alpha-L-arabinofuranosidase
VFAGTGGALALLAAVTLPGAADAAQSAPAATAGVKLTGGPLGINMAPWDALYTGASGATIEALMKQAGIDNIRYGGGTTADDYNWKTDTDIGNCWPNTSAAAYSAKCATKDALYFGLFSKNARATKAQSFVDVNYGSGTPANAAAWVKQAGTKSGQQVALWEIGNENYGCWEANDPLAGAPEHYAGYNIGNQATCPMNAQGLGPGMTTMATSYAVNAQKYFTAMRAVNKKAQIGVPWAFGPDVGGASVGDNTEWNNELFKVDKKYISFVDLHW